MALSYIKFTGDGSTRDFTFPFMYIDVGDIGVFVGPTQVAFTLTNSSAVKITVAPAAGTVIRIRRLTSKASVPVNFSDGSNLLQRDLDLLGTWTLYQAQEAADVSADLGLIAGQPLDTSIAAAVQANASAGQASSSAALALSYVTSLLTSAGSSLVNFIASGFGAVSRTVQSKLRESVSAADFGVPNDGITSATASIQAMITACAASGVRDIYFPPGTYLLTAPASETGEPRSYAAAVIWKSLKNIRVHGSKGTKFTQNSTGAGAPEFAMFRFEECENIELCNISADGSGINIYGVGAARSTFAFICNHNLDTKVDLTIPNRNIHIHHLMLDNFGGGICSATRTESGFAYPLVTKGISIHNIQATNIAGQNHFVSATCSENVHVYNCKVLNPLTLTAHIGNLFADMSAGVVNAIVENNYAVGFTGGVKAETHTGVGLGGNETRPSQNVTFRNNTFEQCGDPITMIYPGAGGGGWYGIKLNGINNSALNNTVTARSINTSTGGLYQGIQLTSTGGVETLLTASGNDIRGTVIGINHDSPSDPQRLFSVNITGNKIRDTYTPASPVASNDGAGIIVSRNALVEGNLLYRTRWSAILIQAPDQTIIRNNRAFDCASVNNEVIPNRVVFYQAGAGTAGFFEFSGNVILDTRGAGAAHYGYFLRAGTTYSNQLIFTPGLTSGLLTAISFDTYISAIGSSLQRSGTLQVARREFAVSASPAAAGPWNLMAWSPGDRAVQGVPSVGSPKAWLCTVAGTPGTWVSEGNL